MKRFLSILLSILVLSLPAASFAKDTIVVIQAGGRDQNNVAITGGAITGITDLAIADGGTGAGTAADAFTALKQNATGAATGVVELATDEETVTGASDAVVCTPGNITAKMAAPGPIGGTTPDELWGILDVNDYTDVTIDVPAISHYGGVIFNNDAGAIEYDLDPALVGMSITLVDAAGGAMSADPNGTETITYDGVTAAAGEILISSGTIGDFLTLICITAGEWMSVGHDSNGWVEATP